MIAYLFYNEQKWITNDPQCFDFRTDGQILPMGSVPFGMLWTNAPPDDWVGEHLDPMGGNTGLQDLAMQACIQEARDVLIWPPDGRPE